MDTNRLTQKSQEALQAAQTKALRYGQQEVDGEHLLLALLEQPEGLAAFSFPAGWAWQRNLPDRSAPASWPLR